MRTQHTVSETYLFEIIEANPHYSFGTNAARMSESRFSEYLHHQIEAICRLPSRYAGRSTSFTIIGERAMLGEDGQVLSGIGTLTFWGKRSEYLGSLPFDALNSALHVVLLGGYKIIALDGETMKRGSARIRRMAFDRTIDEDVL